MRHLPLLIFLIGCEAIPVTDVMDTPLTGTPPNHCDLVAVADVPTTIKPGETLGTSITFRDGFERTRVHWELIGHENAEQWTEKGTWEIPFETSDLTNETLTLRAGIGARGCLTEFYEWPIAAHWTEGERVLVLYNSQVDKSQNIAESYAEARGVPESHLCDMNTPDSETVTTSTVLQTTNRFKNCLVRLGDRITYVVPVFGVPYRLDGFVEDYTTNTPTVTSYDSILMFGRSADDFTRPVVNPLALESDSLNQTYDPFVPIGERRTQVKAPYLIVSRIDGSSAAEASRLISKTQDAEQQLSEEGLSGVVYIDGRYGDSPPPSDEAGSLSALEWNLWGARYAFEDLTDLSVVWDGHFEEIGEAPAPTSGDNALLYLGGFAPYEYPDVFQWNTGAIATHLDKSSAASLRENNWLTGALEAGLTAGIGVVNDPYPKGYIHVDQFSRYLLEGANFGEAATLSNPAGAWQTILIGDPLYRPFPPSQ